MTCLEKLQDEYHDLIQWGQEFFGSNVKHFGCPHMFGYHTKPNDCTEQSCNACWDRELDEVKE